MDRNTTHARTKYVGVGGIRCYCCHLGGGRSYAKRRSRRVLRRRANAAVRKYAGGVREGAKPMR